MRLIVFFFCSVILLASLYAPGRANSAAEASPGDGGQSTVVLPDILCTEGAGHVACQLALTHASALPDLAAIPGPSAYEIAAEMASGRSFAPHTPPPRQLS